MICFLGSAALVVATLIVPWVGSTASASTPLVTTYPGTGISLPTGITVGPDGALWFTNAGNNSIGRITTAGVVSNFTGTGIDDPTGITAGPDGALWFTNTVNNSIGRITTAGVVTNYTAASIDDPGGITAGPDGALWFANSSCTEVENSGLIANIIPCFGSIGRITTGGVVTAYPTNVFPGAITAGPDGALWFTNSTSIGSITTAGDVSNFTGTGIDEPGGIAAGPDGALWFTNSGNNSIGRITTAGDVSNFTGTGIDEPGGIAAGPDGALWFTNPGNNSIGRITTAGVVTNYAVTSIDNPNGIAAGPDGALWFTNAGSIGRITTGADPSPSASVLIPSSGTTLSGSIYLDAAASNATSVEFRLFGGIYGLSAPVLCTAAPTYFGWLCKWNSTSVPNGSYILVPEAFNANGSTFGPGVSLTVGNPLATSVLLPSSGATLSGSTYLDASASNATSVEFLLFGGIFGFSAPVLCSTTQTVYGWLCNWDAASVPNGSYVVVSEAFNSYASKFSPGVEITVHN